MWCEGCPILEGYEGRVDMSDYCDDAFSEEVSSPKAKGIRKTGAKYRRRMDAKKKADELRKIDLGKGRSWTEYDYVDGRFVRTGRFAKHPKHSNIRRLMKRNTNKATRRNPSVNKGNHYRKIHDRWIYD